MQKKLISCGQVIVDVDTYPVVPTVPNNLWPSEYDDRVVKLIYLGYYGPAAIKLFFKHNGSGQFNLSSN